MKKNYLISLITIASFALTLFYACKKIDFHDPAQRCRIIESELRTYEYNAWGDPVSVTYKEDPDATGSPTFHFVYDSRRRLTFFGGYNENHIAYNAKGQAIIDTFIQNYAGQDDRFAERLFYDNYGRIVKVISKHYHSGQDDLPPPNNETTTFYQYDSRGNLILPDPSGIGNVRYDNKTSIYRINPILMLVHRNYSVNNPISDTKYNSAGLPFNFYGEFLDANGPERNIIYDCSPKNGK